MIKKSITLAFSIVLLHFLQNSLEALPPNETYPIYTEFNEDLGVINAHIIPHTHDDPGWLRTFEGYYESDVRRILNSVIAELWKDPSRTFVYVEMSFFMKWWGEINEDTKNKVRELVKRGQLDFPLGGYCQSDEAATYYEDIIEQMTIGHTFLKNEFNFIPKYGWNIDNFGHSATQAALMNQFGFHSFVVSRIDYQDREKRINEQKLQTIWNPYQASGEKHSIFFPTYI